MPAARVRSDLEGLRWKATGSLRDTNRWPGGLRSLACLGCDRRFTSPAKDIRLCAVCKGDGVPDPLDQRVRPKIARRTAAFARTWDSLGLTRRRNGETA